MGTQVGARDWLFTSVGKKLTKMIQKRKKVRMKMPTYFSFFIFMLHSQAFVKSKHFKNLSFQGVMAFKYIPDGAGPVKFRLGLGLAHLHLLPLGLVNEQLPGLGALEGAHDAPLLHLIH